jgi:hypothetical protein
MAQAAVMTPEEFRRAMGAGMGTLTEKELTHTLEKQPKLEFVCPICLDAVDKCQLAMCMGEWSEAK